MHYLIINKVRSLWILILMLIGAFSVCSDESLDNNFAAFQNEIIKEINKQRISYAEDMKFLQEQRVNLSEKVSSYSDIVNDLVNKIKNLNEEIIILKQENNSNKVNFDTKLNELLAIINEDRKKNQQAHETILRKILVQLNGIDKITRADPESEPDSHELYRVVKGDTLGSIAKAFSVPLADLKKINNLENDLIRIDQVLKIPVKN